MADFFKKYVGWIVMGILIIVWFLSLSSSIQKIPTKSREANEIDFTFLGREVESMDSSDLKLTGWLSKGEFKKIAEDKDSYISFRKFYNKIRITVWRDHPDGSKLIQYAEKSFTILSGWIDTISSEMYLKEGKMFVLFGVDWKAAIFGSILAIIVSFFLGCFVDWIVKKN